MVEKYIQFIENNLIGVDGKLYKKITPKVIEKLEEKEIYYEMMLKYDNWSLSDIYKILKYNNGKTNCIRCDKPLVDKLSRHEHLYFVCRQCSMDGKGKQAVKTYKEKHGVNSYISTDAGKNRYKNTMIERYGVDSPHKIIGMEEKKIKSNIEKYGVSNVMHSDLHKTKLEKTMFEKYGVEHHFADENIQEKIKKTNIEKYGVGNPMKNDFIKQKSFDTNMSRYGVGNYGKSDAYLKNVYGMINLEEYANPDSVYALYLNEYGKNLTGLSKHFNVSPSCMSAYFKKNGLIVDKSFNTSYFEKKICEMINSHGVDVIENDRSIISPYELDIYIPSHNMAIEYSGAYWHSELFKDDKKYHYNKWKMCKDRGIQLLTFWDVEFENREEQILSFIKSKLGLFDNRIYARNCNFVELYTKQYQFFEENHIQGRPSSIHRNFGLVYDDTVVGCVSFSHHHRDVTKYTLNRLAFKEGLQIVGGVGKLLRNSLTLVDKNVTTWSDNRFSTGLIYEQNGFVFDNDLDPDYCYYVKSEHKLSSKQSQQKKKIGCPSEITERDFCFENGKYRIWDCGKKRWYFKRKV